MPDWIINRFRGDGLVIDPEVEDILSGSNAFTFHASHDQYESTPLHSLPGLAQELGLNSIRVKDESYRFGLNSFKALGASYALEVFLSANKEKYCFCTATDGNHGRAVAWAARMNHQESAIFIPKETSEERIAKIKAEGASIEIIDGDYDMAVEKASENCNVDGNILIQDTAWDDYFIIPSTIMAGYTTACHEINEDKDIDIIILQGGVGSWAASVIWYFTHKYWPGKQKFVIIEPESSSGIFDSAVKGIRCKPVDPGPTIMAGLNCGIPSSIAWPIICNMADCFIRIPDEYTKRAMRKYYYPANNDPQVISGESGAASLGGLLFILGQTNPELIDFLEIDNSTNILLFNTEGDTDRESFKRIVG